jgi:hypothetical protein
MAILVLRSWDVNVSCQVARAENPVHVQHPLTAICSNIFDFHLNGQMYPDNTGFLSLERLPADRELKMSN